MDDWSARFLALTNAALEVFDDDVDIEGACTTAREGGQHGVTVLTRNGKPMSAAPDAAVPFGAVYYRSLQD